MCENTTRFFQQVGAFSEYCEYGCTNIYVKIGEPYTLQPAWPVDMLNWKLWSADTWSGFYAEQGTGQTSYVPQTDVGTKYAPGKWRKKSRKCCELISFMCNCSFTLDMEAWPPILNIQFQVSVPYGFPKVLFICNSNNYITSTVMQIIFEISKLNIHAV